MATLKKDKLSDGKKKTIDAAAPQKKTSNTAAAPAVRKGSTGGADALRREISSLPSEGRRQAVQTVQKKLAPEVQSYARDYTRLAQGYASRESEDRRSAPAVSKRSAPDLESLSASLRSRHEKYSDLLDALGGDMDEDFRINLQEILRHSSAGLAAMGRGRENAVYRPGEDKSKIEQLPLTRGDRGQIEQLPYRIGDKDSSEDLRELSGGEEPDYFRLAVNEYINKNRGGEKDKEQSGSELRPADIQPEQEEQGSTWKDKALDYLDAIDTGMTKGMWEGGVTNLLNAGASRLGFRANSKETDTPFGIAGVRDQIQGAKDLYERLGSIWGDYTPGDGNLLQNIGESGSAIYSQAKENFGTPALVRQVELDRDFQDKLGQIWDSYEAGDGSLGQNMKDTFFAGFHHANRSIEEGLGKSNFTLMFGNGTGPVKDALGKNEDRLVWALKQFALPALTGSTDKEENAKWLTGKAYEIGDKLTEAVSPYVKNAEGEEYLGQEDYQNAMSDKDAGVQLAGNVAAVVGNMIPSIGISVMTGSPEAAKMAMSASAAGAAAKEAYDAGATPEQAYYIGVEKGTIEYLTECMFDVAGFFGGGTVPKGVGKLLNAFADTTAGRIVSAIAGSKAGKAVGKVIEGLGENVEEAASDWASPGVEKAVLGQTINGEDDISFLKAMEGQLPWSEQGFITTLSTVVLSLFGVGANAIGRNVTLVTPEEAQEIVDYARETGDGKLISLAEQYQKKIDKQKSKGKKGSISVSQFEKIGKKALDAEIRKAMTDPEGYQRELESRGELSPVEMDRVESAENAVAPETVQTENRGVEDAAPYEADMGRADDIRPYAEGERQVASKVEPLGAYAAFEQAEVNENASPIGEAEIAAAGETKRTAVSEDQSERRDRTFDASVFTQNKKSETTPSANAGKAATRVTSETQRQVSSDNISISPSASAVNAQTALASAAEGRNDARIMEEAYHEGQNVGTYAEAWSFAADVLGSHTKMDVAEAREAYPSKMKVLTDAQLDLALTVGRKAQAAKMQQAQAKQQAQAAARAEAAKNQKAQRKAGTVTLEKVSERKLDKKQKQIVSMVKAAADVLSFDFVVFEGEANSGGAYIQGGKIRININSGRFSGKYLGAVTLAHEITHAIQEYDEASYEEFKDFITNEVLTPEELERLVEKQIDLEPNLTPAEALDEAIANGCADMLRNNEAIRTLAEKNRGLFGWIADKVNEITDRINKAYEQIDLSDDVDLYEAARIFQRSENEIRERWNKMLVTANENKAAEKAQGKKNTAETGGVKYLAWGEKEGVANRRLTPIDGELRESILSSDKNHIIDSHEKVVEVVNDAFDNPAKKDTAYFGIMSPSILDEFQSKAKYVPKTLKGKLFKNNKGYLLAATYDSIQHLNGELKLSRPEIIELLDRFSDIVLDNDRITFSYYFKEGQREPGLLFEKTFSDGDYGAFDIISGKRRRLGLQTMYIEGRDSKITIKKEPSRTAAGVQAPAHVQDDGKSSSSEISIADTTEKGKRQNQIWDSAGRELTKGQQRYFAESKIRDADGRLKVMYRGGAGGFTVFDRKKSSYSNLYGRGFYFTDSEEHASQYGMAHPYYLNITNPLTQGNKTFTNKQIQAFLEAVAEDEDYGLENYGYGATVSSVMQGLKGKDDFGVISDINATCIGDMVAAAELFNEVNGTSFDGIVVPTETVAFSSEQIKEIDNENPTKNPDTRYQKWGIGETAEERKERKESVSNLKAENTILRARAEYWKGQTQQTRERTVRQHDTDRLANDLLRRFESRADRESVKQKLRELGDWLVQSDGDTLSYDELYDRARAIAEDIVDGNYALIDDSQKENLERLKDYLKSTPVKLTAEDWSDTGDEGFRKRYGRYFTVSESGRTIDSLWGELAATFGEGVFPEDTYAPGDMLNMLGDYLDMWKPQYGNVFEANWNEAVDAAAGEIIDRMLGEGVRQTPATFADRAQQKLNAQIAADREKLDALREAKNERIEQLKRQATEKAARIRLAEKAAKYEAVSKVKQHYQDMMKDQREKRTETAGQRKYRAQVAEKAARLEKMLLTNSDKLHVPEVLKAPLADFLSSIDFSSKSKLNGKAETRADVKFQAALTALSDVLGKQERYLNGEENAEDRLGGYLDISPEAMDFLRETTEEIHGMMQTGETYTVNAMSAEQLQGLSKLLSNISSAIRNMNSFMANERYATVKEAADADIRYMESLGSASEIERGSVVSALAWENGTPYYVLKRFGEGGKAVFDSFARGWEKMAFNVKKIIDFTEKAYTDKEVKAWKSESHDITLSDGSQIRMTSAQIMELSQLLGREQAMKHIEKGGIRVGNIKGKVGEIVDTKHYHLTAEDISSILGELTPRQMAVAKALQRFMAHQGAIWGNEVSMRRFGYNFYDEGESYYPIRTDSNDRGMQDTEAMQNSMFRLLNLSASKSLNPKASNALIVEDIFDTFADHMADMAKLNGMGLPVLDAIKWFNYKDRIDLGNGEYDTRTLQGAMEQAFGDQAQKYFRTLMKDINGVTEAGDRGTGLLAGLMSNYKAAAVGANLRVAFLQPTSYVRASAIIQPKYLAFAFTNRNAYKEALANSGTAVWKSLGYYDTNISRGMREQIEHNDSAKDKIVEASMSLAELGDKLTWGRLWVACKMQAKATNNTLEGQALINATGDLFREVIYATQVMDSTLTRSELMRGKTLYSKAMTAFMAEPTLSYNLLMDAVSGYHLDVKANGKQGAWRRNSAKLGSAFGVYAASAAFAAVVESVADAFRDDDNDEFWQKFLEALLGEGVTARIRGEKTTESILASLMSGNLAQDLTIIGKLPYVKSMYSTLQGYKSKDMSSAAFDAILDAVKIWQETARLANGKLDKPTKVTYYGNMTEWGKIYKSLQGISQLSGIGAANLTRDVLALWNTTVGAVRPDWKIKTYESKAERTYLEKVYPHGVSWSDYQSAVSAMDADENGSVKQDEAGPYLREELKAGRLTDEQAEAIWSAIGPTWTKTLGDWLAKNP